MDTDLQIGDALALVMSYRAVAAVPLPGTADWYAERLGHQALIWHLNVDSVK